MQSRHRLWPVFAAALSLCIACRVSGQADLGFKVPAGFEVTLYADDALATDIHSLTIDARGRVVVASKGYIKTLHDTTGKGKADKATLFADMPRSGAHGMYFDGPDLICNGDGGVRRLYDTTGAGKADKVSPIWLPTKNDGEHAANGIVRGPDGWYYMIAGNDAGISAAHADAPSSPVKQPGAGVVVRFSPDGAKREIVAHGFRNPYDLAFNHLGQLFTVDADGERIHHMPYYAPTRLFDIANGMHHGWLTPGWMRGWSRPPHFPDSVERMVEIGRGSPTGLVVYRHRAFPERYRNGIFSLCWTFGRVYFFPPTERGSTYDSKMEVFMQTTGDVGFAPTDMAVGPDGDLFIAIGGRGTRGSVFRVRYKGKQAPPAQRDPLQAVLAADEPLSSWSRAVWVPAATKLGKEAFTKAALDVKLDPNDRIRAIEILTELFGGVPVDVAAKITAPPDLVARAIWSVSRTNTGAAAHRYISEMTRVQNPRVARAAWEALQALPEPLDVTPDWKTGLGSTDRRVRAAALLVAQGSGNIDFMKSIDDVKLRKSLGQIPADLAYVWTHATRMKKGEFLPPFGAVILEIMFVEKTKEPSLRMEAVRLMQIALGDVYTDDGPEKAFVGYFARLADKIDAKQRRESAHYLATSFPTGNSNLDLELARLLGMLEVDVPGLPNRIAGKWTSKSLPEDDIHYLLVLSRLPGKRSSAVTQQTAAALAGIHGKLARRGAKPADQVPGILEALLDRLMKWDPALEAALVDDPAFGLPGHAIFASRMHVHDQKAARKLLAGIAKLDEDEALAAWSPELVRLAGTLPEADALPILRRQFGDPRLTDTVALLLAVIRNPEDRPRWIEALSSTQPSVVSASAEALLAQGKEERATPTEIGKAVRALRRLDSQKADVKPLRNLLVQWTGQKIAPDGWVDWFTKNYAKEAAALPGLASADSATWKKRLDKIDWDAGDVRRGETVFQRKNCYRCHGEARRLGPELTGIAQRFSRDDLFTAIFDPGKDISPAFKATTLVTRSGKTYNGMMIYSSPEIFLMQITPDTTARIARADLQLVQPSAISFMPTGLLDDLTDADLRDLYAYMKSLRKK